uniref:Uncharacterized protein n=1 Tax=Euplotes crassus TaxID=5936 RepID=A0A7S3K8Q6_EUPCR|mmetsp:Transcript_15313/g.15205  ORF Transcript_15313/g.15205 Transcript_15313/m.15205 type:complete len:149 (+) Transcript_15313:1-447(+)
MRVVLALLAAICLVGTAVAYTKIQYNNGDEILRMLQLYDGKTYVMFFYDAPGANRDLRTINDYYKDRLKSEILEPNPDEPTEYMYAEIDATDYYGNGYLVDRLNVTRDSLKEKPNIVVMKDGKGNVIYGPTAMNSVQTSLEKLSQPPE